MQVAEYERQRGNIEAGGDGAGQEQGDRRASSSSCGIYPFDAEYAHVLGYKPVNLARDRHRAHGERVPRRHRDALIGDRISDMFTGEDAGGGNVLLTLSQAGAGRRVRPAADNRVGAKRGAAIALDPRTGAVQALVSMPSFDPNPLASHDTEAAAGGVRQARQGPGQAAAATARSSRDAARPARRSR